MVAAGTVQGHYRRRPGALEQQPRSRHRLVQDNSQGGPASRRFSRRRVSRALPLDDVVAAHGIRLPWPARVVDGLDDGYGSTAGQGDRAQATLAGRVVRPSARGPAARRARARPAHAPRRLPPRRRRLVRGARFPRADRRRRPRAWPAIRAGRAHAGRRAHRLGQDADRLPRRARRRWCAQGLAPGGLPDETAVVYVSPLKALSNDIRAEPGGAAGRHPRRAGRAGPARRRHPHRRAHRRHAAARAPAAHAQAPPHILVTTPESLYVLLGSESGRAMLSTVRTRDRRRDPRASPRSKRGSHLALSLERLRGAVRASRRCASACRRRRSRSTRSRASWSAPARVVDGVADCAIVDIGHAQQRDLALELPPTPLAAVMSNEQWEQVYDRLAELVAQHRTTLVFVNTRRMAERAARHLGERLGKERVAAHHGSLVARAAARRRAAPEARRAARCWSPPPRWSWASTSATSTWSASSARRARSPTFLQRVGRSGHAVGGVPKARLFPQSRDELVECAALLDCVRRGELDALHVPPAPLDVLAQQIVAETACREWDEDALFALVRRAWPYAQLDARATSTPCVRMLADGFTTRHGPRGALRAPRRRAPPAARAHAARA